MTIVETTRLITGGVDTHLDVHVAAAVDANGGVLGVESFGTTSAGYRELCSWLETFGAVSRVGVEGTGAYGAGLARHLRSRGLVVIEVDRPNRQERRRKQSSPGREPRRSRSTAPTPHAGMCRTHRRRALVCATCAPPGPWRRESPGQRGGGSESTCTPDSVRTEVRGGHPSGPPVARRLVRPTRGSKGGPPSPCLALLPVGLAEPPGSPRALVRSYRTVSPLPVHRIRGPGAIGGLLSVALSCGSPRLGVTQHRALWSPDVPRSRSRRSAATRPTRYRHQPTTRRNLSRRTRTTRTRRGGRERPDAIR